MQNKIKDSYPNGKCPDCKEPIPDNVTSGQTCKGCGNIFNLNNVGKKRCLACTECSMGVIGCNDNNTPHGHGCAKNCPECGVPFIDAHPHSNVCSKGTPITDGVMHNNAHMRHQLKWKKEIG